MNKTLAVTTGVAAVLIGAACGDLALQQTDGTATVETAPAQSKAAGGVDSESIRALVDEVGRLRAQIEEMRRSSGDERTAEDDREASSPDDDSHAPTLRIDSRPDPVAVAGPVVETPAPAVVREKVVEREVPVFVDRDVPVYVDREVPVVVEREVPVFVDREVPVYVENDSPSVVVWNFGVNSRDRRDDRSRGDRGRRDDRGHGDRDPAPDRDHGAGRDRDDRGAAHGRDAHDDQHRPEHAPTPPRGRTFVPAPPAVVAGPPHDTPSLVVPPVEDEPTPPRAPRPPRRERDDPPVERQPRHVREIPPAPAVAETAPPAADPPSTDVRQERPPRFERPTKPTPTPVPTPAAAPSSPPEAPPAPPPPPPPPPPKKTHKKK